MTLVLLLNIAQQLSELPLLLLIELVGLGAKELAFELGNDRLGLGQLLRLQRQLLLGLCQLLLGLRQLVRFVLQGLLGLTQLLLQLPNIFQPPGRILGQPPQDFFRRFHLWSASRKPRHSG